MASAPVCNVNPQPPVPSAKAPTLPTVPNASDLNSALQAIKVLTQIVRQLAGQIPRNNININTNPGGFTELIQYRTYQNQTVTDPSSGASVTFRQITGMVFQDPTTGGYWSWNYHTGYNPFGGFGGG
jgi:hypothetical protein